LLRDLTIHEDVLGVRVRSPRRQLFLDCEYRHAAFPRSCLRASGLIRRKGAADLAVIQSDLIGDADWQAAIKLALEQDQPWQYCEVMLEALAASNGARVPPALDRRLKEVAWLPTAEGGWVPPQEVSRSPGLEDWVAKILGEQPGAFAAESSLAHACANHAGYPVLRRLALPNVADALAMLGEIASSIEAYRIGEWAAKSVMRTRLRYLTP